MFAIRRRQLLLGGTAFAVVAAAGCGGATGQSGATSDDMVLGAANAPVTLIEYASVTCPHCKEFHETVFEQLKRNYIDTGKVKFIFREYPTPPPAVAVAGFQLARCGGVNSDQYMTRVGVLFDQQNAIFASGSVEGVRQKFIEIGAAAGLSEQQVMGCITDEGGAQRIQRFIDQGEHDFHITGTPTLILNGTKLEDPAAVTYPGLSRILDAALAGR